MMVKVPKVELDPFLSDFASVCHRVFCAVLSLFLFSPANSVFGQELDFGDKPLPPPLEDIYGSTDDDAFFALRNVRDVERLNEFVSLYPKSPFVADILARIQGMVEPTLEHEPVEKTDILVLCQGIKWNRAKNSCDKNLLVEYIDECQNSKFISRIEHRLLSLNLKMICISQDEQNSTPEVVAPPKPETRFTVRNVSKTIILKTASNIRRGPGTNYPIIDTFPRSKILTVSGIVNGRAWYRLKLQNGNIGYVAQSLTQAYKKPQRANTSFSYACVTKKGAFSYKINQGSLNVAKRKAISGISKYGSCDYSYNFSNGICFAIAWSFNNRDNEFDGKNWSARKHSSKTHLEKEVLKRCNSSGHSCRIRVSVCSTP